MGSAGVVALVLLLVAMACGSTRSKGSLVIGLQTDVSVPDNVDGIGIAVGINGSVKYSRLFSLANVPGKRHVTLPATIVVVEPDDGSTPAVDIRAVAFHQGEARIVRDVISTVPHGRTALLRLPLAYLGYNDGVHGSVPTTAFEDLGTQRFVDIIHTNNSADAGLDADLKVNIASRCSLLSPAQTNVDGECVDPTVDSSALPDYVLTNLFENGVDDAGESKPEACFDMETCFAAPTFVPLDRSNGECKVAFTGNLGDLNVAMRIQQPTSGPPIGFCNGSDDKGQVCAVPIDRDDVHGFRVDTTRGQILLPQGVCDRATVTGIELAHGCPSKTVLMPIDGAGANCLEDGAPQADAGTEGGTDASADAGSFPLVMNPWIGTVGATQVAAIANSSNKGDVVVITKSKTLSFHHTVNGMSALASQLTNVSGTSNTGLAFVGVDPVGNRVYATFGDGVIVYATYQPTATTGFDPGPINTVTGLSGKEKLGQGVGNCNDSACFPDESSATTFTLVTSPSMTSGTAPTTPYGTAYAFAIGPDNVTIHGAYENAGGTAIATGLPNNLLQTWTSATALRAFGLAVAQDVSQPDPIRVVITVAMADNQVHLLVVDPSAMTTNDVAKIGGLAIMGAEPFVMRNLASDAKGNVYFTDALGNLKMVNPFTLAITNVDRANAVCPDSFGVATDSAFVYRACSLGVTRDALP